MNQLTKFLVDGILNEGEQKTLAAYGGGFKPPTTGHFEVIKQALKDHPEIDEFIIYVGSGVRDGITQAESVLIWEIYQTYLPMKVKIEPSKAPIGDVLRLGKDNPQDKVYFVLGAREENEGDFEDIKNRTRAIGGKHPNVEVKIITTKDRGMSGTNARKAAKVSFEDFAKFLPTELSDEEKETVYNIIKPVVKESLNENASYSKDIDIKQRIMQLTQHMLDKGMNIEPLPNVKFVDGDKDNAREFLGKTAYYDPNSATIVLYTEGRHPKDIVRSFAHEMIHHIQNLEGRLNNITTINTQEDDALNDIEAEANLKGTMTFRNWTDSLNENILPQEKFAQEKNQDYIEQALKILPNKDEYNLKDYTVEILPIDKIKPTQFGEDYINASSEYEAKQYQKYIDDEIEAEDLRREDFYPIVVDKDTMEILDGNHRHAVHTMLSIPKIKAILVSKKLNESNKPYKHKLEEKKINISFELFDGTPISEDIILAFAPNSAAMFTLGDNIEKYTGLSEKEALEYNETPNDAYVYGLVNMMNDGSEIFFFNNGTRFAGRAKKLGAWPAAIEQIAHEGTHLTRALIAKTLMGDKYPTEEWPSIGEQDNDLIGEEQFATALSYVLEKISKPFLEMASKYVPELNLSSNQSNPTDSLNESKKPYKHKHGFNDKLGKDPFGLNAYALELAKGLEEELEEGRKKKKDPKKGTGKKPKGSSRRLYTDEDPKDTVGIKFRTKEDIVDTLNKKSFKTKSHARQSQIINLIHQRVRAAYQNTKDPDTRARLKRGLDYIEKRKEASKKKTQRLKKQKTNENLNVETTPKMLLEERLAYYKDYYINISPSTFDIETEGDKIIIEGLDKSYPPNFDEKKDVRQVPVNENVPDAEDDGKAAPYGSGYKKLNEGRYDTISNKISKIIFEAFKDIHDSGKKEDEIFLTVGPDDEDIFSDQFEFHLKVEIEITDDEYSVDGGANVGFDDEGDEITPLISVRFKIPKNPDWQKISFDIKDVVRHELEHLTQDGENLKPGKYMQDDQFLRDLIDANLLPKAEYFKLEKEIDAMLQGMYFKAKKSKTPFKKVLNDYLDIFLNQGSISKEDKEDVLNLWRSRRKALSLPPFE